MRLDKEDSADAVAIVYLEFDLVDDLERGLLWAGDVVAWEMVLKKSDSDVKNFVQFEGSVTEI